MAETRDSTLDVEQVDSRRYMPPRTSHEYVAPTREYLRVHIDFAGPLHTNFFCIVVDSFSISPEVLVVNNTASTTVINILKTMFATHGLCETLVSNNTSPFTSSKVKHFLDTLKIRHVIAPYHPSNNGLADRMLLTIKNELQKMPWDIILPKALGLQVAPSACPHNSPAELLLNRRLSIFLDTVQPDFNYAQMKNTKTCIDQQVMYKNYSTTGANWLPGKVVNKTGPSSFSIQTDGGVLVNRHIDQLVMIRACNNIEESSEAEIVDIGNQTQSREEQEQEIIQIPNEERWPHMLGIPYNSEISTPLGNIKHTMETLW